ncbi:response regulator transcription factor [Prevotella sp. A2931]|uniref:Response regulator transcription factor n=1 Tax=Prevotella illustrans TaxID=2800387 RepID=A0ABS3M554_9BACT|nr:MULTISPECIES: response regulator transcription factor [Prevotella]MBO1363304.1 response regulator transcription factor [Prevotella illustrans]PTL25827.1 helix-turn-helix transcriptional regulator [Prevotella sp. oral taxon 820]
MTNDNLKQKGMRPKIAIIDKNTLAVMGLKQILQNVMPIMKVDHFATLEELQRCDPDSYVHYFVAMNIILENRQFFLDRRVKTIVLVPSNDPNSQLKGFNCLCQSVSEEQFVKNLLILEQHAHPHGEHFPEMPKPLKAKILSAREIEVLSLIAQGMLNKEIAEQLNIGMTTVITHRKNIIEKLGLKSVSALTIYAVMHGYVDISKI